MAFSQGDFEKFYNEHVDKVYRFVLFRVGVNKEIAEDLVSEIFIKALKNFASYDVSLSQSAWIMTIARNHVINYYRDNKSHQTLPEDEENANDSFWLKEAKNAFRKDESQQELYELLKKLSVDEQEIVTFHYIMGYSYIEIAQMKGVSAGSIKIAAHRAIKKMKKIL